MKQKTTVYLLLILSLLWAVLIFILCTMPSDGLPRVRLPHIDKLAHFGFFFIESLLLSLTMYFRSRQGYWRTVILVTMLAFVYGGMIELLQSNCFNRTGDPFDLLADVLGGFLGAIIHRIRS
ncbi:MAG: VanZ family protein [Tannerella sp.]|nr:VanZ family protein [Tannerella sp.]